MGGWSQYEESKLHARALALALARAHLGASNDVVVAQYLGRTDFIETLQVAASEVGAEFKHGILMDDQRSIIERFHRRRRKLGAGGVVHPQADFRDDEVNPRIADAGVASRVWR